jgi:hypothetical protein
MRDGLEREARRARASSTAPMALLYSAIPVSKASIYYYLRRLTSARVFLF